MTERNEPQPSEPRPTAPTDPTPFTPAPAAPAASVTGPVAPRRPWYRHVWVPVAGAVVLVLLAFGSGFVAGQATSLFRVANVASGDGPAWGDAGADEGPGWHDGGPGHRDGMPGLPGQRDRDGDGD